MNYTTSQVATMLNLSRRGLEEWIKRYELPTPPRQPGVLTMWTPEHVEDLVDAYNKAVAREIDWRLV